MRLDINGFEALLPGRIDLADPVIDLRDCTWVQPDGALGVFLLIRYFIRIGKRPTVYRPLDPDVDSYFERTGVPIRTHHDVDYVPDASDIIMNAWRERATMQEITQVRERNEVARIVEKLGMALKEHINEELILRKLKSAMLETFQNIPDHANPENDSDFEGYVNIQSYENGRRVVVAVGDLGVGIHKSLSMNDRLARTFMSELDAIKKAVLERFSRFTNQRDRGGGLGRAAANVKNIGGYMIIRSGSAALTITPYGNRERSGLKHFPGTQIAIKIEKRLDMFTENA